MTDGEPETAVLASFFYCIKSQTSDSFVNHFYGHFAYCGGRHGNMFSTESQLQKKERKKSHTHIKCFQGGGQESSFSCSLSHVSDIYIERERET